MQALNDYVLVTLEEAKEEPKETQGGILTLEENKPIEPNKLAKGVVISTPKDNKNEIHFSSGETVYFFEAAMCKITDDIYAINRFNIICKED